MSDDSDMGAWELFFWLVFFATQMSWLALGLEMSINYLIKVFDIDETARVVKELAELRRENSESEIDFDKHYKSKDYVYFVNEK